MTSESRYSSELADWRAERDRFFASHYATPLSGDDLERFSGLCYFSANPVWVFSSVLEFDDEPVAIESSAGTTSAYPGAGTVLVPFATGPIHMRVLCGEDDDLFIPFRDKTSGVTTYGGGRYVGAERDSAGRLAIDFNKATNPYCAYDPEFSCPLPPAQNWLPFAVEAGELDYPTSDE